MDNIKKLGGLGYTKEHPSWEVLNANFNAVVEVGVKGQAQIPYQTLKSTGDWVNESYLGADRFTTANGVNTTLVSGDTTATFSSNKYILNLPTTSQEVVVELFSTTNKKVVAVYVNSIIPDDTQILVSILANSIETIGYNLNENRTVIIPLLPNMSGSMKIKFKLSTSDTSKTPELFGYGVYLK